MSLHNAHVELYLDRESAIAVCWDIAKDATGIRPRWIHFDALTLEEIHEQIRFYESQIKYEAEMLAEYEREQRRLAAQRRKDNAYRPNRELAIKLSRAFMSA